MLGGQDSLCLGGLQVHAAGRHPAWNEVRQRGGGRGMDSPGIRPTAWGSWRQTLDPMQVGSSKQCLGRSTGGLPRPSPGERVHGISQSVCTCSCSGGWLGRRLQAFVKGKRWEGP